MAKTILIVDDEPNARTTLTDIFAEEGYDVIEAANGNKAIEALTSKKPDIIILDYLMPDMDGVEVLKKIRQIDNKIPVIMFTGHADERSIKGAQELGVSAFIPKLSAHSDVQFALKTAIRMIEKKVNDIGNVLRDLSMKLCYVIKYKGNYHSMPEGIDYED